MSKGQVKIDKNVLDNQKEKAVGFFEEFKQFISDSSVIDMIVGVIIGGAVTKIVSSLVNDIFMPLVGIIIGGVDFSQLTFQVQGASVNYGTFLMNIVDFLIVAFCLFLCIKIFLKFRTKFNEEEDGTYKKKEDEKVLLLREIRDELKKNNEA
jgi:large conductance mechanosensitive channel